MSTTYIDQLLDTITDIETKRMVAGTIDHYADHSDPDTMPTADEIEDMHQWAARAEADTAHSRLMARAHGLMDRAYMSSRVGYAQSAIATAQRALPHAAILPGDWATAEAEHLIAEATRLIDRLNNSYAAAKGRY
ncbi:hypothetical protein J4U00_gp113 [Mycobacterium phage DyoEdafos]|uniref:Uncharacterized protein n=1 Tax=Mycobacterium phage DyoEdafos TaxID=2599860 RepID=A0A5J6TIE3_9CAUD|nr:hypothetical protein J4U00_gp113 [Mycobacterium phage DyoEdafos]QFG10366.1 hypothetical protein SEA_DYOEDAFOS_156 [Mycobacterium phage DyoEdafos]